MTGTALSTTSRAEPIDVLVTGFIYKPFTNCGMAQHGGTTPLLTVFRGYATGTFKL